MTSVVCLPRSRRRRGCEPARKRNVSITFVYVPLLAALALGVAIDSVEAEPHAVALVPTSESAAVHAAHLAAARTSSTDCGTDPCRNNVQQLTVAVLAPAETTGAIPDQQADIPAPKPHLQTPPVTLPQPDRAPAAHVVGQRPGSIRSSSQAYTSFFAHNDNSPVLDALTHPPANDTHGTSRLRLALLAPKTLVLRPLDLPSAIEARIERNSARWPQKLVGIASTYNPNDPNDRDAGNGQTASGEMYDGTAWTAAIRTDLRAYFGGVHYGRNYRPAYALIETDHKRVIVKINDVGPLAFGRIIDLNKRTMHYFDPSMRLGLIHDMRVIPLPGTNWTPGPIDNGSGTIQLADAFGG